MNIGLSTIEDLSQNIIAAILTQGIIQEKHGVEDVIEIYKAVLGELNNEK